MEKEEDSGGLLKKQTPTNGACFPGLQLYDLYCLRAFIAFNDIKAHSLAFGQGLETIALNGGVVSILQFHLPC
jgi:hypothetical protein